MAGDVNIVINAQDKASATLAAVSSRLGAMSQSFTAVGPSITGLGSKIAAGIGAFYTIKTAIEGVASAANRIDALSDKANGLGESVGSLQEFQFALAEAGNISGEKAISVLEKLSATVGGIASGDNKEGLEVFKKLGLDAQELSVEGPIAQFEAIQQKLGEIENLSERAATAQKLFGKAALELLPALSASADSMRDSAEYARKVGAAVGDDATSAVAAMNDAIGRVGVGMEGVYNTVAVTLAPAVEGIALTIADWLPPLVEMAQSVIPDMIDGVAYLADAMLDVADALGLIAAREGTWAETIEKSRQAARERAGEMEAQREAMRNAQVQSSTQTVDKKAEDTMTALERQLSVLLSSETQVKNSEQLAQARTDAEYEYIQSLQDEIAIRQTMKEMEAEDKKKKEEAKKEQERLDKLGQADKAPQQATQGRLLTRGTGGDQALLLAKQQVTFLQQIKKVLDDTYNRDKNRDPYTLTKLVVP